MKRTFIPVRILLLVLICSLLCSCHTATTSNNKGTEACTNESMKEENLKEDIPFLLSSIEEVKATLDDIDMESQPILVAKDGVSSAIFCQASYYSISKRLDIVYTLGDVDYRFEYYFDKTEEAKYEGTPILSDIVIDTYTVDFYKDNNRFFGSFMCNKIPICVFVYSDKLTDVSFDAFEFEILNKISSDTQNSHTYNFDSYNSFYTVFAGPNSAESTQISAEKSLYSKEYSDFIDLMMTDGTMVVPKLNGDVIELRNMDNYAQISLFTQELYNLPWIWYHCQYSGDTNLSISITDLSVVENLNVSETHKISDIVRKLAPDAPNVDNYENFSGYKSISETEIQLYDRQVSALYYELNNDDRIMVAFVYDDMYVLLRGLPTTLTEDFFEMFSVGKY